VSAGGSGTRLRSITRIRETAPPAGQQVNPVLWLEAIRDAEIRGVGRIEASILGHDVQEIPAPAVPRAHRLVLGDHSKVQISS
jgi:hypothetical protein